MRIAVVGGTQFIGPAIVEDLLRAGHDPVVVHRGLHEPTDVPVVPHVHCDRHEPSALRRALRDRAKPDAVIDTCAYSRADAETLAQAIPPGARTVVLSSMDVYRVYGGFLGTNDESDAVPLDEDSPVRVERYVKRGRPDMVDDEVDLETYEKLDVEEVVRAAGAVVLRLPFVYGAGDLHPLRRREEFILRRVRAGRKRIPFGAGNLIFSRGWVKDIASAARLAAETRGIEGTCLNVGERRSWTIEQWARRILVAAGSGAELVRVPDASLPSDLAITAAFRHHFLVDSSRARRLLGWEDTDPEHALRESVRWHLANPPPNASADFSADDAALATAS
jgi:nucleoside-diphosphate-sugar epimerase